MVPPTAPRNGIGAIVLALAVPLATIAAAYALWWWSDQAGTIGPFDRATFGWFVVMPLWWLSPAAAAIFWRRLSPRMATSIAIAVALIVAAGFAAIAGPGVSRDLEGCEFGARSGADSVLAAMVFLGLLLGGAWAAGAVVASRSLERGRALAGLLAGTAVSVFLTFGVIVVAGFELMSVGGCNRPPS